MIAWFLRVWTGREPLARLFWIDTILVASVINVVMTLVALVALAAGAPAWLAAALHFSTLPYNITLVIGIWRAAAAGGYWAGLAKVAAILWFAAVLVV